MPGSQIVSLRTQTKINRARSAERHLGGKNQSAPARLPVTKPTLQALSSDVRPGVLVTYLEKPEIPVGKSNGSLRSVRKASGDTGCDLNNVIFLVFLIRYADLDTLCSGSFCHLFKFCSFLFMHKFLPEWFE